jgi:hypothetical protein
MFVFCWCHMACLSFVTAEAALWLYEWNTHTHTLTQHNCTLPAMRTDQNKQTKLQGTQIISASTISRQKLPRHFDGYLEFFADFERFHLFIPRFLAEPRTTACWALDGNHRKVIRKQILHTRYAHKTQHKHIYASAHTYIHTYARTHTHNHWEHTYACINTEHTPTCRGVAGEGEWCPRHSAAES